MLLLPKSLKDHLPYTYWSFRVIEKFHDFPWIFKIPLSFSCFTQNLTVFSRISKGYCFFKVLHFYRSVWEPVVFITARPSKFQIVYSHFIITNKPRQLKVSTTCNAGKLNSIQHFKTDFKFAISYQTLGITSLPPHVLLDLAPLSSLGSL